MMDPSSAVQQQGPVDHVLHAQHSAPGPHQQDLSGGLELIPTGNVTGHLMGSPPGLGIPSYMQHGAHTVIPTVPPSPVHIVSSNVTPNMSGSSPYVHPGLMQEQTEKYGPLLFHKDDQGLYTCFFTGCGKKLKANFSRHVAKHEMDGDKMDPGLATQIQTSSASKNLGTTKICSHPTHQEWWGTSPEQPVTEFYKRCSKCKKCYIRLQQESKRQRLSLESLNASPMNQQSMGMVGQYGNEMYQQGVNGIGLFDQHLKRDSSELDGDVEHSPTKRLRIEENPQIAATISALADKHFREMAELTARHSADSRKLISHNSNLRLTTDLRLNKEKEELEAKLRNEWDMFRMNCLKEREDLYQAQVLALHRELQGAQIPSRPCRLCSKRMLSTFLYQCNLCNEEACIRCQAVMVCGVCGTKSCENCTIKHNWLIWCDRCHKTFCSNHRGIPDNLCPGCENQQKSMDLVLMQQQHHGIHDLDQSHHQQSQSLHGLHQDVLHPDQLQMHHHHHHHNHDELMPAQLKFEDLDHDHHHHHSHHDPEHHLHHDQSDLLQHDQDPHSHHHHHHHHHLDEHSLHQHLGDDQNLGDDELADDSDLHHHNPYDSELQEHQHEHQPHPHHPGQNGQEHHDPHGHGGEPFPDDGHKYDDLDPHSHSPSFPTN